jgi:hypothetical protein
VSARSRRAARDHRRPAADWPESRQAARDRSGRRHEPLSDRAPVGRCRRLLLLPCSASDRSSASNSASSPAAASHMVVAPPKSRCCSRSDTRNPGCRAMMPRVGCISPVSNRKSVVLPVPFRPTMPHRSRCATVNVTWENRCVAPKSTPTSENESWSCRDAESIGWLSAAVPDTTQPGSCGVMVGVVR